MYLFLMSSVAERSGFWHPGHRESFGNLRRGTPSTGIFQKPQAGAPDTGIFRKPPGIYFFWLSTTSRSTAITWSTPFPCRDCSMAAMYWARFA